MANINKGKVKNAGKVFAGGTPKTEKTEYYGEGYYWLPSGRVQNSILSNPKDGESQITELGLKESSARLIKPNSVLVAITGATCSNVALLKFEATANQSVVAIEPKDNVNPSYLFYGLLNLRDEIIKNKSGGAQGGVNLEIIKNLPLSLPDLAAQQRIAAFLDERTGKIDALVEEFAKFKANLQLQKRSLVSECVTKGLPSERDVVKNWIAYRLKQICGINTSKVSTSMKNEDIVSFIPMEALKENVYHQREKTLGEVKQGYTHINDGDVIFAKVTPCFENRNAARTVGLNNGFAYGSTEIVTLTPSDISHQGFLYYITISNEFVSQGTASMRGNGGLKRISSDFLNNFRINLPPLDEQQRIADYLDIECSKIDALVSEIDNQVNLLKTYRKSLINEAVTGKLGV